MNESNISSVRKFFNNGTAGELKFQWPVSLIIYLTVVYLINNMVRLVYQILQCKYHGRII